MIPAWISWIGYGMFVLAFLNLAYEARNTVRYRGSWYGFTLHVMVAIYLVGVALKATIIGPDWLRFHLADFGFPVMVASLLLRGLRPGETLEEYLSRYRMLLLVALGLSIAYEISCGLLYYWRSDLTVVGVGRFDPIDVGLYALGTATGLWILSRWRKRARISRAARSSASPVQAKEGGTRQSPEPKLLRPPVTSRRGPHGRVRSRRRRQK